MGFVAAVLNSRLWRAFNHLGVVQLLASVAVAIFSAGGVLAIASAWLETIPGPAQALILLGVAVLAFALLVGVFGWVNTVRRTPASSQLPVAPGATDEPGSASTSAPEKTISEALVRPAAFDPNAKLYVNQRVHLSDLVRDIHPPLIRNRTFEGCEIIGPAFLHPRDSGIIEDIDLNTSGVVSVMQVEPGTPLAGVVVASGCVFRDCGFHEIVLVGDADLVAKLRAELKLADPQQSPFVSHQAVPTHGIDVRCTTCGWEGAITEFEAHKAGGRRDPDAHLLETACREGALLWERYADHPMRDGQEQADQQLRDRLRAWEGLVRRALGRGPDRERFDAPVNTSGMDNRIQVSREQLRVKLDVIREIAGEQGIKC
jgi:hypothetical protein